MGATPAPEEQFGPYLVYERLGVGGMATVHRALEHTSDGRERMVALKRLLPHLADDASFIKAFVREAKLASLLSHVNIVQIYELGRVGPAYFISMEYIDGRDVRQILRSARRAGEPPPMPIVVALMIQLCDALDYAHHKDDGDGTPLGLVHRDVSPSNLLVNASGQLKIIDFGIAKAESNQLRTQTGRVKGKLAYMAPEAVAGGRDLDARSDIWACGVILHELLTARPLFASKNEYQTLLKVQRGDIMPPSTYNQTCPPELDGIVFRALARDPDERFALAADMRDELMALRSQYQLASGYRDVATWLTRTRIDEPAVARRATSKPKNRDEDEAVDLVWGASESANMPIELPDVPDVSRKPPPRGLTADDDAAFDDDAPTPVPRQRERARFSSQLGDSDAGLRMPPATIDPALSAGTDPPRSRNQGVARRSTGPRPAARVSDTKTDPVERLSAEELFGEPDAGETLPQFTDDSLPTVDSRFPEAAPTTNPMGLPLRAPAPTRPTPAPRSTPTAQPATKPTATPAAVPVVRFAKSIPPQNTGHTPLPTRQTNRGLAVVTPVPAPPIVAKPASDETSAVGKRRSRRASEISVGAGMVARHQGGGRRWVVMGFGVLVVGGATAAIVMSTGSRSAEPKPAAETTARPTTSKVRFVVEPNDAEIRIDADAPHTGAPWAAELAAGTHPIEIRRAGYKSWLTSLDLAAGESQLVRVELVPLGTSTAADAAATLSIATTPPGLEAELDGKLLEQHTPIKLSIKTGAHTLAVRQNGVEVWHQSVNAEPNSDYEFHPTFADKRPAAPALPPHHASRPEPEPEPAAPAPSPPADSPQPQPQPLPLPLPQPQPQPQPQPSPQPPPPPPAAPAPAPAPARAPAAPPHPTAPALVPPTAVTKVSGEPPHLEVTTGELPTVAVAKLCIDPAGTVTSATVLTKLPRGAATDLAEALHGWRYAPYKQNGTAIAACFTVSFRLK